MLVWSSFLLLLLTVTLFARAALASFSWSKLERLCAKRPERLSDVFRHHEDVAAALRAWFWLLVAAFVLLLAAANGGESHRWLVIDERFLLLWLAFIAVEVCLTRPLAGLFAEHFLLLAWPSLHFLRLAMSPVVWTEKAAEALLHRLSGRAPETHSPIQEELLTVVNEGRRDGSIRLENAEDMIEGLIELHEIRVSDVMTPRTQMQMLKSVDTIEDARRAIGEHGHSRIPVHGENRDEIVGVLYAKDLLPHLGAQASPNAELVSIGLRPPMYVPESKPVDVLLKEFQRTRVHIAIVLDEYGGVSGLVTIEDILEEIVGDIADEYDEYEAPPVRRIDEGKWEVGGRVRIEELNEMTSLGLPEDAEYDTIAGYVFHTLGRVPKVGEVVRWSGASITVVEAGRRTVDRVRIELPVAPADSVSATPAVQADD
jgi:CBS domain containing-hemolysin-like protein